MPQEIERRFLLKNSVDWLEAVTEKQKITQIYLSHDPVTRLRFYGMYDDPDARAIFTVKGKRSIGKIGKLEVEWEIPKEDAKEILFGGLSVSDPIIKTRYLVPFGGFTWEIDVFDGLNQGLMIAEVELEDESQDIVLPDWVGEEITDDHRYSNSSLSQIPLKDWHKYANPA
jgi:adenylate cyclase